MILVHFLSRLGLLLCLTVLPFVLGRAFLQVLNGRQPGKIYKADAMPVGMIIGIGAAEAVHLAAFLLKRSFSDAVFLFVLVFGILFLASLGIVFYGGRRGDAQGKRRREGGYTTLQTLLFIAFSLLVVYQIVTITLSGRVYRTGDMTVETVISFLETNDFYKINPLTGAAYEEGVPFRLEILCLNTLYGALCKIFGLAAAEVVWEIVPLITLLGSYLAFYILADCFFPERDDRDKRLIFMLLVAAVFCVGDYRYGMDGFGLLYSGFRGVTIRNTVLLPYTFGLVLRRRWKMTVLCVLAEACIVWTLYGMGACLLVVAAMLAVRKIGEIVRGRHIGKEA